MSFLLSVLDTLKRCLDGLGALAKSWLIALIGVLLLSMLIWYEGPLLSFGGHEPFASEAQRGVWIVALLAIWAMYFGWQAYRAWRANRLLMDGIAGAGSEAQRLDASKSVAELNVLRERMQAALAVLRKANPGWKLRGQYLYQLPWYLFVGAPGSGKTTALTHSGLQFPLDSSLGAAPVGGLGGTRHCDWWFTDEAVLLDTAGRYTIQDSDTEVDKAAWSGFLGLLKKHRRRSPVNGVIVSLSVSDLLRQSERERRAQATAIRARIQELYERLDVRFPVYVIVTKCDLLAGFTEFFEQLGREERMQVWGMTFPLSTVERPGHTSVALACFAQEFDALERQLQIRVLERMQQERDLSRRALLYGFPQQFASIRDLLGQFLSAVFEPNRYQQPALVRGVYFTSGTQEGSPIDRVLASLAAAFGLGRRALPANHASGRSYFITRLLREVIFREAELVSVDARQDRRRSIVRRAGLASLVVLTVLLVLAMTISYQRNQALVQHSETRTAEVAQLARELPSESSVLVVLPLLNAARQLPAGYAERDASVPMLNRMGLYQGDKLEVGAVALYRRLLRSSLLPPVVASLENALRRGDASNQDYLYETLRVYLMLGQRQYFDTAAIQVWAEAAWRRELPQASETQRRELAKHIAALFDAEDEAAEPIRLDAELIAKTRLTLANMPLAQRVYQRLRRQVAELELPESSVSAAVGRDVSSLLVRKSGAPLSRGVSGVYGIAGYREILGRSARAVSDMAKDNWVLDRQEAVLTASNADAMRAAVLELYYADYIQEWEAFLGDLQLTSLHGLDQAAAVTGALAASDSPLRLFLAFAAEQTTLSAGVGGQEGGDPTAKAVRQRLDDARKRLESTLGDNTQVSAATSDDNPVDRHFAALHDLAGGKTPGRLDEALGLLKEAAQYFDSAEAARRSGTPAPSAETLSRLKRAAGEQPMPLSSVMREVESGGSALTLGNERERLNALWATAGAPFCRDAIAGRYPLVPGADREITADDFGKFFGYGGLMDDFFNQHLAPYIDTSSSRWHWRSSGGAGAPLGIAQEVLDQFQRGARLRDTFFLAGTRQPSLRFDLKPLSASPELSKVTLDIAGQPVILERGASADFRPIVLPSGKGSEVVSLRTEPASGAGLRSDGPWAWLRLLDKGRISDAQGERYRLTFSVDGRQVAYELRARSVINPFRRDALGPFRCPATL